MYIPVDLDYAVKRELRRRRSSELTIKSYLYWIHRFLKSSGKTLDRISKKDVREFLYSLDERKLAGNTLNVAHMAIRFLFEEVLDKRMWIDIKYSKVPKKIQRYLTKEEIERVLKAIKNPKHQVMIKNKIEHFIFLADVVHIFNLGTKNSTRFVYSFMFDFTNNKIRLN